MKKLFIVANWKSNKTELEAKEWLKEALSITEKEIIVCPPFTAISAFALGVRSPASQRGEQKLGFKVGAQDISPFDQGAYTGEVNGKQIKEFADYVIIGHSERRKNFSENEEMVNRKIEQAFKNNLTPILCISDIKQVQSYPLRSEASSSKLIVVYEPLFAIGSGSPDTPENAEGMAKKIKEIVNNASVLYGGSVDSNNVSSFTKMPNIDGVLVGKASLDPRHFLEIIKNA